MSCTVTTNSESFNREISFQVARHASATTKADVDYRIEYENVPFGSYAWYKGENQADDTEFFKPQNQEISYNAASNSWTPTGTTYYWPKSGTLDFISYSPYVDDGTVPAIAENLISYPAWDVEANPDADLMYATKAVGLSQGITDNYYYEGGVPTLFHHALAKVAFRIKASRLSMTAETGDVTRWEITVNSVNIGSIQSTGTLELPLGDDGKNWTKPESNVWTPAAAAVSHSIDITPFELTVEPQPLGDPFLVLPQLLEDGQTVNVNVTIRTFHDDGTGEKPLITETGVDCPATLKVEEVDRWGINQYIIYTLILRPYATITPGPGPDDDSDPVAIFFDPATSDWDVLEATTTILL